MKRTIFMYLLVASALFANAQTYSKSDLQKYVANKNANSPIKTSMGDLILNATLIGNALYETTVMGDESGFNELQSELTIFKDALVSAYAKQVIGKMLIDTNTTFIMIWVCKDAAYPPFQIVIYPDELKTKM